MTKIIAFEGIDGTGKTVQMKCLSDYLKSLGKTVKEYSFPMYDSFFGSIVGQYLTAKDGIAANTVDGKSMEPVYHDGDYVYYEEVSAADPGEDVLVDTEDGAVIKRVDDDYTLYSVNPAIPYPKKSDQNTLVIRGRVLGVVASSDRPSKDDISILEELFIDEIREFNEEHGVNE